MCGRFTLSVDFETIKMAFNIFNITGRFDHVPRYNIAPTQMIPVIAGNNPGREISIMRWGLIPFWAKDPKIGHSMFNARAETIDQKPAFRDSFRSRRCLVPADGFFEWKRTAKLKLPMRFVLPDRSVFAFAGIWDRWEDPAGKEVLSCSIITTAANSFMAGIHERMPAILKPEDYSGWLEAGHKELLQPYPGEMDVYEVPPLVNSPRNDIPECIEKVIKNDF
jgi:putative SOS response-associated peptidase YedK